MSEAKPRPTGPERRWRKEQSSNFKSIEKRGRIVLLAMGAVVLASIIIGSWFWLGSAQETSLHCYPYGSFNKALLSPAPWFFHDATQLYQAFGVIEKKNIRTKVEGKFLIDDLKNLKDDTVLIYVAGRGIARNNEAYVLPSDATDDPSTWISLASVIRAITDSPSKNKLLLLDIAGTAPNLYTGPLQDSIADVIDEYLTKSQPPFPVFTSCSKGETSNVMAVTGNSVFGYYLNQALRGLANGFGGAKKDEQITVRELMIYVSTRVNRWATLNLGRTQTPKPYGPENLDFLVAHRRKVAWLDEPPKTAESPVPTDETKLSDKEKQENKDKRDKQQKEIDQARLRIIFPNELEEGWKNYDPWIISLMQETTRSGVNTKEQTEYPLRLASLTRFATRLRQYEETLMLFSNHAQNGQSQETQSLLTNLNISGELASKLSKINNDTRTEQKPNSITALWPRSWLQQRSGIPRDIPRELVNAFETLYQSVPGNSSAPAKTDAKIDDKSFLILVSGKKDEKTPASSLHQEALFLCWDTLCEDTHLTLDKLIFTEDLMKKILADNQRGKLHVRCNELDLLKWIIEQSQGESEWNFVSSKEYGTNKELELNYFEMIHQWLMVEYLDERCANSYLPDGTGFASRQASLDAVRKQHQSIVQKMLAEKMRKKNRLLSADLVEYARQLKALSGEYTKCLKDMGQERAALDSWWDAVAILQATAEMMVSEDDSKLWLQWERLADNALKLRPYLQAKSLDSSARESIESVIQARGELAKSFNKLTTELLKSGNKDGAKLESSLSMERILKSSLLTSATRKELHGILMKLQQKNHNDTIDIEREDDKGTSVSKPLQTGLSVDAQMKRRALISRQLLRLGGLATMENNMTPREEELRKAWSEEMPKLHDTAFSKAKWLEAARVEAVLPQTDRTDALLNWRLDNSRPYHQWLEARQQQLEARQLHVADLWK